MKVQLEGIWINDKKKDGTFYQYKDKNGQTKAFKMASIKVNGEYHSCGLFKPEDEDKVKEWQQGQEVNLIFEEKNGFKNFRIPSKLDKLEERITFLENFIYKNEQSRNSIGTSNSQAQGGQGQDNILGERSGNLQESYSVPIPENPYY